MAPQRGQERGTQQVLARVLEPLGVVLLTRERIHETLEEAVQRGRVTRTDANDLAGELVRRGRVTTEELVAEVERMLEGGLERLGSASRRTGLTGGVNRVVRTADAARRTVTNTDSPPLADYDRLTARQVQSRLGSLRPAQLRQLHDYERRHANRKTVLEAIERAVA
jgi:polyhydroxyalkanoate synthesis regulator phasin